MRTANTAYWILGALSLAAVGCGNTVESDRLQTGTATLRQATSCDDLEQLLRQDALVKMNAEIDAMIRSIEDSMDRGGFATAEDSGFGSSTGSGGEPSPTLGGDNGGAPPDHSETNTQVKGVDEADIVKTDGNHIYLLHGQSFLVMNAWPTSDLGIGNTVAIEGEPVEMFVDGDKVVIYSHVDSTPIDKAGLPQRETGYGGGYYGDMGAPSDGYYYGPTMTKITVLQMSEGSASVLRELYFEGSYNSSRRVDSHVRTILSGGDHVPQVDVYAALYSSYPETESDWVDALEQARGINMARIMRTSLADWLPYQIEKKGDAYTSVPIACESYFVPSVGSSSYGLTQVASIDLDTLDQPAHTTSILGGTQTVYATADALYLASSSWNDPMVWALGEVSTTSTHLHKFDLATDPNAPQYVASGSIPGMLHNQFSLDEKDGTLRASTTNTLSGPNMWQTVNGVYALQTVGGALATVGKIEGLAPGESIYSTRFVGDRGYVVTFRQVDPLFVIDLSAPTSPKLVAELKIPGFSEYMHPIDDTHLLTIGQDGTDGGQITGLAVQLFDVSDAANPTLMQKSTFEGYGYSEAEQNHKAFTYYDKLGLLAFPYAGYADNGYDWKSSLEVFKVDIATGIEHFGSIDHTGLFGEYTTGYCGGYYGVSVRRGLFIEDALYSISYGGVIASSVADLSEVASLALPAPTSPYDYYGCY